MDSDFLVAMRAVYIQSANTKEQQIKALQQERAALLDLAARVKRILDVEKEEAKNVVKSE